MNIMSKLIGTAVLATIVSASYAADNSAYVKQNKLLLDQAAALEDIAVIQPDNNTYNFQGITVGATIADGINGQFVISKDKKLYNIYSMNAAGQFQDVPDNTDSLIKYDTIGDGTQLDAPTSIQVVNLVYEKATDYTSVKAEKATEYTNNFPFPDKPVNNPAMFDGTSTASITVPNTSQLIIPVVSNTTSNTVLAAHNAADDVVVCDVNNSGSVIQIASNGAGNAAYTGQIAFTSNVPFDTAAAGKVGVIKFTTPISMFGGVKTMIGGGTPGSADSVKAQYYAPDIEVGDGVTNQTIETKSKIEVVNGGATGFKVKSGTKFKIKHPFEC